MARGEHEWIEVPGLDKCRTLAASWGGARPRAPDHRPLGRRAVRRGGAAAGAQHGPADGAHLTMLRTLQPGAPDAAPLGAAGRGERAPAGLAARAAAAPAAARGDPAGDLPARPAAADPGHDHHRGPGPAGRWDRGAVGEGPARAGQRDAAVLGRAGRRRGCPRAAVRGRCRGRGDAPGRGRHPLRAGQRLGADPGPDAGPAARGDGRAGAPQRRGGRRAAGGLLTAGAAVRGARGGDACGRSRGTSAWR